MGSLYVLGAFFPRQPASKAQKQTALCRPLLCCICAPYPIVRDGGKNEAYRKETILWPKKHHGICAFTTKDEITVDILLAKLYNL